MPSSDHVTDPRLQVSDPFHSDFRRAELASSNSLDLLSKSYLPGMLPELPDLSSESLWAEMASYEGIPDFRLKRLRQVTSLLPKKGRILDVGSGWGEIIPMVLEEPGREYVAMDFSQQMIDRLTKKFPTVRAIKGGINDINEKFDVILALEVCEHIPSSQIMKFYADVQHRLVAGGKFIVTVPLYENLKALTLQCPNCHHMHNRMGHVRSYTPELIAKELKIGGFEVIDLSFVYLNFNNTATGVFKRVLINWARALTGLGKFMPLNAVIVAQTIS